MSKSPDAFRTISEVADWLEIQAHVLRFWESKFTQVKPVKRAGGRRYYRPNDMLLLGGIQHLLHEEGLSIKDTQALIREKGVQHVQSLSKPLEADEADEIDAAPAPVSKWADQPDGTPPAPKVPRRSPADRDPPEERASASRRLAPLAPPLSATQPQIPPSLSDLSVVPDDSAPPAETDLSTPDTAETAAVGAPGDDPAAAPGTEVPPQDLMEAPPGPADPQSPPESAGELTSPEGQTDPQDAVSEDTSPPASGTEQMAMPMDLPDAAAPERGLAQPSAPPPAGGGVAPDAAHSADAQQDFFAAPPADDLPADDAPTDDTSIDDLPTAPLSEDSATALPLDTPPPAEQAATAVGDIDEEPSHFTNDAAVSAEPAVELPTESPAETPTEAAEEIAADEFASDATAQAADEPTGESPDETANEAPAALPDDPPADILSAPSANAPTDTPARSESELAFDDPSTAPPQDSPVEAPLSDIPQSDFSDDSDAGPVEPDQDADIHFGTEAFDEADPSSPNADLTAAPELEHPLGGSPLGETPQIETPPAPDTLAQDTLPHDPLPDDPLAPDQPAPDPHAADPLSAGTESDAASEPVSEPAPDPAPEPGLEATEADPALSEPDPADMQEGSPLRARVIEIADEVTVAAAPGMLRRLSSLQSLPPEMHSQLSEIAQDLRNTLSRG
mgnify:CR=1 FL=1